MEQKLVEKWNKNRDKIKQDIVSKKPCSREGLLRVLLNHLAATDGEYEGEWPDPERIGMVDFGHYQGTTVYVIGAGGYQPDKHWALAHYYGSCSGCDTFQRICEMDDDEPQKWDDMMTMALHFVQKMKEV